MSYFKGVLTEVRKVKWLSTKEVVYQLIGIHAVLIVLLAYFIGLDALVGLFQKLIG